MHTKLFSVALCLLFVVPVFGQDDQPEEDAKPGPVPKELREAMDLAITMLEEEKYEDFLVRFIAPDEMKRLKRRLEWTKVVRDFRLNRAETFLKGLIHIKKVMLGHEAAEGEPYEVMFEEDMTIATFPLPRKFPGPNTQVRFRLFEGKWYLMNN